MSTFNEDIAEMRGAVKEILWVFGRFYKIDVLVVWRDKWINRLLDRWCNEQ